MADEEAPGGGAAAHGAPLAVPHHDFNTRILHDVAHRPWPMPRRPWVMTQTWHELLFAHWPVRAVTLRALVPPALPLDLFQGQAWVGIVPFYMTNVALRGMPAIPGLSAFPELNVRTYVRLGGKPGVYFFSLDAANGLAVQAARWLLRLPYHRARMDVQRTPLGIDFESRRRGRPAAAFAAAYRPGGPVFEPEPGSLEYFLTERYCLYGIGHRGRPYRLEIHHPRWSLQPAAAEVRRNSMAAAAGVALPSEAPLLHYSRRQDMVAWAPARAGE